MGALTSNIKRGAEVSSVFGMGDDHIVKKPRVSVSSVSGCALSSIASRVSQYPEIKSGLDKRVHGPVRNLRFSPTFEKANLSIVDTKERQAKTNSYFMRYEQVKKEAFDSLRCPQKDLDDTIEGQDNVSDELSIENVDSVEDGGNKRVQEQVTADSSHEDMSATLIDKLGSSESSIVIDEVHVNVKQDETNSMGLEQLHRDSDIPVPRHRSWLDAIKNFDFNLDKIYLEIQFHTKILELIRLVRPVKIEDETKKNAVKECFIPLSKEEEISVSDAMSNRNRRKVVVAHEISNIDITGEKFQCLGPGKWLNDEVINLYLELLKEREKREPKKFLKCHFFNTFFYKKLISGRDGYNFQSVRRWTTKKKLGYSLLECKKIFVPIHKEVHWCLAIIDKEEEKFQYLDSLGGYDSRALNVLARYFVDEVKDKTGQDIDVSSWNHEFVDDLPVQENGYDCGVFMIKYADFHSRGFGLCFSQDDMPYFRQRIASEILKLRAE